MEAGASFRLFAALADVQVQSLLSSARRRRFTAGEVIFHEGDPADSLHLVERGRVAAGLTTSYGNQVTYSIQGPGEIFGELALLTPDSRRSATIVALEPTETRAFYREDFERLRHDHPQITELLLRILAVRVRSLSERLTEALYVPVEVRIRRRLLELADSYPGASVPLTQDQLGGLAGAARATVNRVLRQEAERGTIRLERRRITVLDRDLIASRAR
jgi:CRP-like cAMP-binding protein